MNSHLRSALTDLKSHKEKDRDDAVNRLFSIIEHDKAQKDDIHGFEIMSSIIGVIERHLPYLKDALNERTKTTDFLKNKLLRLMLKLQKCLHAAVHTYSSEAIIKSNLFVHLLEVFSGLPYEQLRELCGSGPGKLKLEPIKVLNSEYYKILQDVLYDSEAFDYIESRPELSIPLLYILMSFTANDFDVSPEFDAKRPLRISNRLSFSPRAFTTADTSHLTSCISKLIQATVHQKTFPADFFLKSVAISLQATQREPVIWSALLDSLHVVLLQIPLDTFSEFDMFIPCIVESLTSWWERRKLSAQTHGTCVFRWPVFHCLSILRVFISYAIIKMTKPMATALLRSITPFISVFTEQLLIKESLTAVDPTKLPKASSEKCSSLEELYLTSNYAWLSYSVTHLFASFYILQFLCLGLHTDEYDSPKPKKRKLEVDYGQWVVLSHLDGSLTTDGTRLHNLVLHSCSLILAADLRKDFSQLKQAILPKLVYLLETMNAPQQADIFAALSVLVVALKIDILEADMRERSAVIIGRLISKHPTVMLKEPKLWQCLRHFSIDILESATMDSAKPHITAFFSQLLDRPDVDSVDFLLHLARNKSLFCFDLDPVACIKWLVGSFSCTKSMSHFQEPRSSFSELFFLLLAYDNHSFFSCAFTKTMPSYAACSELVPSPLLTEVMLIKSLEQVNFSQYGFLDAPFVPEQLQKAVNRERLVCQYDAFVLDLSEAKLDAVDAVFHEHLCSILTADTAHFEQEVYQAFILADLLLFYQELYGIQLDSTDPLCELLKRYFKAFLEKSTSHMASLQTIDVCSKLALALVRFASFAETMLADFGSFSLRTFVQTFLDLMESGLAESLDYNSKKKVRKTCGSLEAVSASSSGTGELQFKRSSIHETGSSRSLGDLSFSSRPLSSRPLSFLVEDNSLLFQSKASAAIVNKAHNRSAYANNTSSTTNGAVIVLEDDEIDPKDCSQENSGRWGAGAKGSVALEYAPSTFPQAMTADAKQAKTARSVSFHSLFDSLFFLYFKSETIYEPTTRHVARACYNIKSRIAGIPNILELSLSADAELNTRFNVCNGVLWPPGSQLGLFLFSAYSLPSELTISTMDLRVSTLYYKGSVADVLDCVVPFLRTLCCQSSLWKQMYWDICYAFYLLGNILSCPSEQAQVVDKDYELLEKLAESINSDDLGSKPLVLLCFYFLTTLSSRFPFFKSTIWAALLKCLVVDYNASFDAARIIALAWPRHSHSDFLGHSLCSCLLSIYAERGASVVKHILPVLVVSMERMKDTRIRAMGLSLLWKLLFVSPTIRLEENQWAEHCIVTWAESGSVLGVVNWLNWMFASSSPICLVSRWLKEPLENFCRVPGFSSGVECGREYLKLVLERQPKSFFLENGENLFVACLVNEALDTCEPLLEDAFHTGYDRSVWFERLFPAIIATLEPTEFVSRLSLRPSLQGYFSSDAAFKAKFKAAAPSSLAHVCLQSHPVSFVSLVRRSQNSNVFNKLSELQFIDSVPKAFQTLSALVEFIKTGISLPAVHAQSMDSPLKQFGQITPDTLPVQSSQRAPETAKAKIGPKQRALTQSMVLSALSSLADIVHRRPFFGYCAENCLVLLSVFVSEVWEFIGNNFVAIKFVLLIAREVCCSAGAYMMPKMCSFYSELFRMLCAASKENLEITFSLFYHIVHDLLLNKYSDSGCRKYLQATLKTLILKSMSVTSARLVGVFLVQFGRLFHPALAPLARQLAPKFSLSLVESDCVQLFKASPSRIGEFFSAAFIGPCLFLLHHFLKVAVVQAPNDPALANIVRTVPLAPLIKLLGTLSLPERSVFALKIQLGCIVGLLVPKLAVAYAHSPLSTHDLAFLSLIDTVPSRKARLSHRVSRDIFCNQKVLVDTQALPQVKRIPVREKLKLLELQVDVCRCVLETLEISELNAYCCSLNAITIDVTLLLSKTAEVGGAVDILGQSLVDVASASTGFYSSGLPSDCSLMKQLESLEMLVRGENTTFCSETWFQYLACSLAEESNLFQLQALVPSLVVDYRFAQLWFPVLLFWFVSSGVRGEERKQQLSAVYEAVFQNHERLSSGIVDIFAKGLLFLRRQSRKDLQSSFDNNFWFKIDYLQAATACFRFQLLDYAELFLEIGWTAQLYDWDVAGETSRSAVTFQELYCAIHSARKMSSERDQKLSLEQQELLLQALVPYSSFRGSNRNARPPFPFLRAAVNSGYSYVGSLVTENILKAKQRLSNEFADIYHESLWQTGSWDVPTVSTELALFNKPNSQKLAKTEVGLNTLLFDYFRQKYHQNPLQISREAPLYGQLISWVSRLLHNGRHNTLERQQQCLSKNLWPFTVGMADATMLDLPESNSILLDMHTAKLLCDFKSLTKESRDALQLKQLLVSAHFKKAMKTARRNSEGHKAARFSLLWRCCLDKFAEVNACGVLPESEAWYQVEQSKLFRQTGQSVEATTALKQFYDNVLRRPAPASVPASDDWDQSSIVPSHDRKSAGYVLLKLAQYVAESRQERPKVIVGDYFRACISDLAFSGDVTLLGNAHYELACFADRQFEQGLADHCADSRNTMIMEKAEKLQRTKQVLHGCQDKEQTSELKRQHVMLERTLRYSAGEQREFYRTQFEMLQLALSHYLDCLAVSNVETHKHDQAAVFRFVQLCQSFTGLDTIYKKLYPKVCRVLSFKFLPVFYQLIARLSVSEHSQFQLLLKDLVDRVSCEHPLHTMVALVALANGSKTPTSWNVDTARQSPASQAAIEALRRNSVRIQGRYGSFFVAMLHTVTAYINLAEQRVSGQSNGKNGAKHTLKDSLFRIDGLDRVPVLTRELQVRPRGDYDYNDIVTISKFSSHIEFVGGINSPKKCVCVGSDGRTYPHLVKGCDDLRQDAVLSSIFSVLNSLFKRSRRSRELNLQMEVYRVVALNSQAGILQWLDKTVTLGAWLHEAHPKYRPTDMSLRKAREKMANEQARPDSTLESKLNVYSSITSQLKPVFRHFFWERFFDPCHWLKQRQIYVKSLAVASIAGYVVGLGDRHADNLLIGVENACVTHIDLGIAFDYGRLLVMPEWVPFRLTRDMVDGMGPAGPSGLFQEACELSLDIFRHQQSITSTLVGVFLHDPLRHWTSSADVKSTSTAPQGVPALQAVNLSGLGSELETQIRNLLAIHSMWNAGSSADLNKDANNALLGIQRKLASSLSVKAHVLELISSAQDPERVCRMYHGWQAWL